MISQPSSDSALLRSWKCAMVLLVQALAVSATVSGDQSHPPSLSPTVSQAPTATQLYCRVEMVDVWTSHESGEDEVIGDKIDEFQCEPILENGESTRMRFLLPEQFVRPLVQDAVEDCQNDASCPGVVISIPGGTIQGSQVDIPDPSQIAIVDYFDDHQVRRALAPTSGVVKMAILRIKDTVNDSDCGISHNKLENLYFATNKNSLSQQTYKCSRGTLTITKTNPVVIDVPINLDTPAATRNEMFNAATGAAENIIKNLGYSNMNAFADYFIYAMPPVPGWIAYASVGGRASVYNAEWARYLTVQQHEIGHNMGIRHTFETINNQAKAYEDRSGVMGGAIWGIHNVEYGPQMCFNAAHFGHSGWHSELTYTANPNVASIVPLVAFVDHDHSQFLQYLHYTHATTTLAGGREYWIHYNAKRSYNIGTAEYGDMVTISRLETNAGHAFRGSLHIGAFDPDATDSFFVEQENGKIWRAEVCNVLQDGGLKVLGLYMGYVDSTSYSFCTDEQVFVSSFEPPPTSTPTGSPISPTSTPTGSPTGSPVTASPTSAPTSSPTKAPTQCTPSGGDCSSTACCSGFACQTTGVDTTTMQIIQECRIDTRNDPRNDRNYDLKLSTGGRNRGGVRQLRGAK